MNVNEAFENKESRRDPKAPQIMKRLHIIREQAEGIAASARHTADAIMGPEPENNLSPLKEIAPSGFFGEVNEAITAIERMLGFASDSLRRFEREF